MLNGIDPIIIFQFSKNIDPHFVGPLQPSALSRIPIISQIPTVVDQPPIPIYLSQTLTGLHIESEDKTVDIDTTTDTLSNGQAPDVNQKGISSIVSISLVAVKESLGVALLSAMVDTVFDKASSKEYSITYMHGAVTVFRGVLHSFSINQNNNDDKYSIKIEISKGSKAPQKPPSVPVVANSGVGTVPL